LDTLQRSPLLNHVSRFFRTCTNSAKRPKIAIIDTGFDAKARWFSHRFKKRLSAIHWKDFWDSKESPCDNDGHGTAMLSMILTIAPFSDICVARIAGEGRDLIESREETCAYAADVSSSMVCQKTAILMVSVLRL